VKLLLIANSASTSLTPVSLIPRIFVLSSHSFDSGTQMVVASRPIGACIEVDRRRFIKARSSLAALC